MTVLEKETLRPVEVYDIWYDRNGYPTFLYYQNGQLLQKSAKYFTPNGEAVKLPMKSKTTKSSLRYLIDKARQKTVAAQAAGLNAMNELFSMVFNADDIPSAAENADNLADAVECYIQYGEYDIDRLMDEIEVASKK